MTEYGQTIPPKWFQDRTVQSFTKAGFARYLHRALVAVGMLPIRLVNPLGDVEQASMDEFTEIPIQAQTGSAEGAFWFYDFPTSETHSINGITYRPCIALSAVQHITTGLNQSVGECVGFHLYYRRADRVLINDFQNLARLHINSSYFGMGSYNDSITTFWQANDGAYTQLWNWKPSTTTGDANHQTLLSVAAVDVILGKGGLLIQVGNGQTKTDNNNILNVLYAFGGARIPDRKRVPSSDGNLNLVMPVMLLDFVTTNVTHYYTSNPLSLKSYILGMQHDLLFTTQAVRAHIYNQENIERPIFPFSETITKDSPRSISGIGRHILNRLIYISYNHFSNGLFFGPLNPAISNATVPTWEDCWTFPGVRAADNTAPVGEYVDPTSNVNWWLFRAPNLSGQMAVDVEGATKITVLPTPPTYVQTFDTSVAINTAFAAAPNTLTLSWVLGGSLNWTAVPGNNEMTLTGTLNAGQSANADLLISGFEADAADAAFDVYFEAYARQASGGTPGNWFNHLLVQIQHPVNDTTFLTPYALQNAGSISGHGSFNYAQRGPVRLVRRTSSGALLVRFNAVFNSGSGVTKQFGVRNIRIVRTTR